MAETSPEATADACLAQLEKMRAFLSGGDAASMEHFEIETYVHDEGFELLRLVLQEAFDRRAADEARLEAVTSAGGVVHGAAEEGHARPLGTVVGTVTLSRWAYRHRGQANLYPADADLNLPVGLHSHGCRQLAAIESARGSFEAAAEAIGRSSGSAVAKRQTEGLARAASVDFEAYYQAAKAPVAEAGEVVVLSADGKGVVMRSEGLRAATAAKAAKSDKKLKGRLSRGEKANRKRLAEVGAVYTLRPVPRSPDDVMARGDGGSAKKAPEAANKWLTASVVDDAAGVIASVFDEAERRDPRHERTWVALVDGNNHQIDRIQAEAAAREIEVTIVVDWIHVLEYLWSAAWSFFDEGNAAAEDWVHDKAIDVLSGRASIVAAAIRRKATTLGLDDATRKNADVCANYLLAKAPYLDYPTALENGWPIATGVIEGACRHIVKDRMDITGARWGLEGAEAVLKLRVLRSNGDWDEYWKFHLAQERTRVHEARYLDGVLPVAA